MPQNKGRLTVPKGKRISRARFLRAMGAAGVVGSGLSALAACQPNTTAQSSSSGGGGGPEEKKLNLYNWTGYIGERTLPDFQKETGIQVTQDFYASNEELLAKLQAGATGYDVIVPSGYMVEIMRKTGVIRKLDASKIPNSKNIGANFKGLPFDPKNEYSIPYQWGTTGVLYNRKEVGDIESWSAMWDPKFEGKISMLNDTRETLGAALYKLGLSVNTTDTGELQRAADELKKQKPLLSGYLSSDVARPALLNGDVLLAHVFWGDAYLALSQNEDLGYVLPMEGATRFTDNLCIPSGAQHPENAHAFVNYVLGARVGAEISDYTSYNTPNEAALPMVDGALKKFPGYVLPDDVFDRLQEVQDVGEATREYDRIFTEVKSS